MILIADSGSTKTFWAVVDQQEDFTTIQTQGLNPYFTTPEQTHEIILRELVPDIDCQQVSAIHFYGAGCSTEKYNNRIRDQLHRFFPAARIDVHHDILGAARALFGNKRGIACILGTGSNSCYYDGSDIHSPIPSLGYLFGDEGAGSYLGKKFLSTYLKEELPEEIRCAFDRQYHYKLEDILTALYSKPFPNRFLASFSLFLHPMRDHPFIHDLICCSFLDFIKSHIFHYDHTTSYPIGFIGSIAFYYGDILREAFISQGLAVNSILLSPLKGLVKYHRE